MRWEGGGGGEGVYRCVGGFQKPCCRLRWSIVFQSSRVLFFLGIIVEPLLASRPTIRGCMGYGSQKQKALSNRPSNMGFGVANAVDIEKTAILLL